jgi:hypothetical protein
MRAAIGTSSHPPSVENPPENAKSEPEPEPEPEPKPKPEKNPDAIGVEIEQLVLPDDVLEEFTSTTELRCQVRRLRESQVRPNSQYMSTQADLNWKMREILVDWLGEVQVKFKLKIETLFQAVHLLDCTLSRRSTSRKILQLVGCTALFLAGKFEEIYYPEISDFVAICDKACTREQILEMEDIIVRAVEFQLECISPFRLMELMAQLLGVNMDVGAEWNLALFYLQASLQKQLSLQLAPEKLAAAALFLARCSLNAKASPLATLPLLADGLPVDVWTVEQHGGIGVPRADLVQPVMELREAIRTQLDDSKSCKWRGVNKKFQYLKYNAVASMPVW